MTLCAGYEVTSVTKNTQVVFPKYYPIAIINNQTIISNQTVYHWISNPVTEINSWPILSIQWKYCN